MTTFREAILPGLDSADRVVGMLDLAPSVVTIVTRMWSGGKRNEGNPGDTFLQLPQWTIVRELGNREVMDSGGDYVLGDLRVGPIRPTFQSPCGGTTGGFTIEQLQPPCQSDSTEVFYNVVQAHGLGTGWSGDYNLVELNRDDPFQFILILHRRTNPNEPLPAIGP
jgi:hypothetical protein